MTDMLVMVTSRGRPENFARLMDSWRQTLTSAVDLLLIVDDDDPTAGDYEMPDHPYIDGAKVIGAREGHIGSLNTHARNMQDRFRIIGQMGDDHYPLTIGWERQIKNTLKTTGIAYPNDLFQGVNLPTASFFTSDIIRATGRFAPENLWHLYADNYWYSLGANSGCLRYLPGCVIEHLHPMAQKSEWDDSYRESNSEQVNERDRATWELFCEDGSMERDIIEVRKLIGLPT